MTIYAALDLPILIQMAVLCLSSVFLVEHGQGHETCWPLLGHTSSLYLELRLFTWSNIKFALKFLVLLVLKQSMCYHSSLEKMNYEFLRVPSCFFAVSFSGHRESNKDLSLGLGSKSLLKTWEEESLVLRNIPIGYLFNLSVLYDITFITQIQICGRQCGL